MFYESFLWWVVLIISISAGFFQQVGLYGRGTGSQKIELFSNLIMLITFIYSFFIGGFIGGVLLIGLVILVNSNLTRYLVRIFFIKTMGFVPEEREQLRKQIFQEAILNNSKDGTEKMGIVEIEKEVCNGLNIKK